MVNLISTSNILAQVPNQGPEQVPSGRIINILFPNLSPISPGHGIGLFESLLQTLITLAIIVAVLVFFFLFLIGAIRWILSGGDKTQVETARKTLTSALIGLVLVLSFFAIVKLVESIFGVSLLQINIGALTIR